MTIITIHDSGEGSDRFRIDSWYNGGSYNFRFGQAGSPMRNLFLQGDDATQIRDAFDHLETLKPDTPTRDVWLEILDPYL